MQIIKKLFIGIVILMLIIIVAAVIFIATFDINRFKPQIVSQASKALNRTVNFDSAKLGISLRQGVSLEIYNLAIAEDPASAKKESLTVKQVLLGVDALEYLLRKKINISSLRLNNAALTYIDSTSEPVLNISVSGIQANFIGSFSFQAIQSDVSGKGDLLIQEVKLKDLNILRMVLDKISLIPGLSEKIEQNLSERFKQKLAQKDTVLQDINFPFTIVNSRLIIKDAVLSADEFIFKGEGQINFDTAFSLEGSFLIPAELSSAMTRAVPELEYLLNNDKQIYIPLRVTGKASDVKFRVDTEYIAKRLFVDQAKKQIFKALDKALGTQEPIQAQPDATQQQEPGQQEESKESQIKGAVENILEDILGK
jgi:hypothetical protein